jgi:hypothetical protein
MAQKGERRVTYVRKSVDIGCSVFFFLSLYTLWCGSITIIFEFSSDKKTVS